MIRIILKSFLLVFLAELGDKTQLSTMLLASKSKSPFSVFIGSSLALILTSYIGVHLGDSISRFLPPNLIKIGASFYFIIIGIIIFLGR